jgi:hypothetical protein
MVILLNQILLRILIIILIFLYSLDSKLDQTITLDQVTGN